MYSRLAFLLEFDFIIRVIREYTFLNNHSGALPVFV